MRTDHLDETFPEMICDAQCGAAVQAVARRTGAPGRAYWRELKAVLHETLRRMTGFDLVRYNGFNFHQPRRLQLLRKLQTSCVIDVGANCGQYGRELRSSGYKGRIVSFEPLSQAVSELALHAAGDPLWSFRRAALGNRNGSITINVAGNSVSSSILPMLAAHTDAAPESRYVGREEVSMVKLESVMPEIAHPSEVIWLKLDAQGFESQILDGAGEALDRISAIELELSMKPLYENQTLYFDMIERLRESGFSLAMISPGLCDRSSGALLQADGIFLR